MSFEKISPHDFFHDIQIPTSSFDTHRVINFILFDSNFIYTIFEQFDPNIIMGTFENFNDAQKLDPHNFYRCTKKWHENKKNRANSL